MVKTVNTEILLLTFTNKTTFVFSDLQQSLLPMKNTEETKVRLSEQISGYMIDEISSESSAGGRRFLRNPEKRIHKNVVRKQSPATTEDENTEDLLTPFSAGKTSLNLNKHSTQKVFNNKSKNSSGIKSKEVEKYSVNNNGINELLVVQENDENDLSRISVLSFNNKDSLSSANKEASRNESKMSTFDDQLILSVDELMNDNRIDCGSYCSTSRFDKSYIPMNSFGPLNKTNLRETISSKKISKNSSETRQSKDAEVQTVWSGYFSQNYHIPHNFPIIKYEEIPTPTINTTLKMQNMTSSLINYKTLDTLTTYNPCLTALDNMLKQQINLTREFLTTQRNLHETISKAISQCVITKNYN
uniref:DUF4614 domain-containing protein n=1 Tax=Schistosoma mansoni TaxID=6183 RepID=A0A5K4ENX9_SCHMA